MAKIGKVAETITRPGVRKAVAEMPALERYLKKKYPQLPTAKAIIRITEILQKK
jgi:hypothetical protein